MTEFGEKVGGPDTIEWLFLEDAITKRNAIVGITFVINGYKFTRHFEPCKYWKEQYDVAPGKWGLNEG